MPDGGLENSAYKCEESIPDPSLISKVAQMGAFPIRVYKGTGPNGEGCPKFGIHGEDPQVLSGALHRGTVVRLDDGGFMLIEGDMAVVLRRDLDSPDHAFPQQIITFDNIVQVLAVEEGLPTGDVQGGVRAQIKGVLEDGTLVVHNFAGKWEVYNLQNGPSGTIVAGEQVRFDRNNGNLTRAYSFNTNQNALETPLTGGTAPESKDSGCSIGVEGGDFMTLALPLVLAAYRRQISTTLKKALRILF